MSMAANKVLLSVSHLHYSNGIGIWLFHLLFAPHIYFLQQPLFSLSFSSVNKLAYFWSTQQVLRPIRESKIKLLTVASSPFFLIGNLVAVNNSTSFVSIFIDNIFEVDVVINGLLIPLLAGTPLLLCREEVASVLPTTTATVL